MKQSYQQKIETIMRSNQAKGGLAFVLFMLSMLYVFIMKIRAFFYSCGIFRTQKLPCKVISIGNITLGGVGKTPMTIYLAQMIHNLGFRVAILSRGYKGKSENTCGIVSDGKQIIMDAASAGDEPFLMAEKLPQVPIVVGKNRYECGQLAIHKFSPQVILLDDAFQHLRLHRDINIVLMDATEPLGNNYVVPRGLLREPVSQLNRGQMFLFTRARARNENVLEKLSPYLTGKPVFSCQHMPDKLIQTDDAGRLVFFEPASLSNQRIFAFSGIANNDDFLKILNELHYQVADSLPFKDHHVYSDAELYKIAESAKNSGAQCLVTTEKDYVKIYSRIQWPLPLFALRIQISFGDDTPHFETIIKEWLTNQ